MKYRDWEILEELPEGWQIDKTAGSPYPSSVFITNGKSVFNGQKRAILKVKINCSEKTNSSKEPITIKEKLTVEENFTFPAKTEKSQLSIFD